MTTSRDKAGMGSRLVVPFRTSPLPPPLQLLSPVLGVGRQELLHRVAGEGLVVDYTFSRQPFSGDPHMVSVHIHFSNSSDTPIKGLHVGTPKLPAGISIQEFPEIGAEGPWTWWRRRLLGGAGLSVASEAPLCARPGSRLWGCGDSI